MIKLSDLSIRNKLILIQIFTTLIVLVLFTLFQALNYSRIHKRSMILNTTTMAQLIAANSVSVLQFLDDTEATNILATLDPEEEIIYAWIHDADGGLFASFSRPGYPEYSFPNLTKESHTIEEGYLTVTKPIVLDNQILGHVSLRASMSQYQELIRNSLLSAAIVLVIGLVLAFALSMLFQRTVSQPISFLVDTVKEVSKKEDFSIRVRGKRKDELGILYDGFNKMLSQIEIRNMQRDLVEQALRESEEKFSKSFRSSPDPIMIISVNGGRFLDVNPSFERSTGYKREEILNRIGTDVNLWANPEKGIELLEKIKKEKIIRNFDIDILSKKGNKLNFQLSAEITDFENTPHIVSIARDITEVKKAEKKLETYRDHLEDLVKMRTRELEKANIVMQKEVEARKAMAQELAIAKDVADDANFAKSQFLANMSHELRTPMNSIMGFSEVLINEISGPLNEHQKDYMTDILESARHLLSLINDVLDLSKVEAGKMELDISRFDMKHLITHTLGFFREKAVKHSLNLKTDIDGAVGEITADERRIKQVIFNLVSNAVKFTADGGNITITARIQTNDRTASPGPSKNTEDGRGDSLSNSDYLEVAVQDTGIGIANKDLKKLFQPFQQVDSSYTKQKEGTGLGLNLSKKIIELHDGRIWAESKLGKGSRFTFSIPIEYKSNSVLND